MVWPLAILAVLAVLGLAVLARRRGLVTGGRLTGGAALALVPIVLAPVLAQAFWIGLTLLRPGYAAMPIDPYRPLWYRLAVIALTAAVLLGWYALLRRRFGPAALAIGGLTWLAVLGVFFAAFVPGGSYLTALPALIGAVAGVAAILLRGGWAAAVAVLAGAVGAVLVLLPAVLMFLPALGLRLAAVGGFITVLLGLAVLPVLELLHPSTTADLGVVVASSRPMGRFALTTTPRSRRGLRGMDVLRARRRALLPFLIAVVASIAFAAVGLRVDRFDTSHPVPTHLMYALDSDTGEARWFSGERSPQTWTAQYVSGSARAVTGALPAFGSEKLLSGPATAAVLPPPAVTLVASSTAGDSRTVRLRLAPRRPVRLVTLHVGEGTPVTAAVVGGRPVPVDRRAGAGWGFGFTFHAPPPSGVEVVLTVRGTGPVKLRAMDASDGLASLPGFHPRPADVGILGSHTSEMVAVARTYTL
jgi:hypothetical protein